MTSQQLQDIDPTMRPTVVDRDALGPEDFYWWDMEQAGGDLGRAVHTVASPDEAIKFVLGMEAQLLETWNNGARVRIPGTIRNRVHEALQTNEAAGELDEPAGKAQWWEQALTIPVLTLAIEKLRPAKEEVSHSGAYLHGVFLSAVQESQAKLKLTDEHIRDLRLIAAGTPATQLASERGVDTRTVSKERRNAKNRLKADTQPHAVRLGIEHGFIGLDKVPDGSSDIVFTEHQQRILDLYSRGVYDAQIAETVGADAKSVDRTLQFMLEKLSANGRTNMVKRAFEEGILKPDAQTNVQLDISSRLLDAVDQLLLHAGDEVGNVTGSMNALRPGDYGADESEGDMNGRLDGLRHAFGVIEGVAGDVFSGMQGAYRAANIDSGLLTPGEQEELEGAAWGPAAFGEVRTRLRSSMCKKLGALTVPHAIRRAIEAGYLSIDLQAPDRKLHMDDERATVALSFVSEGYIDEEAAAANFMSQKTFLFDVKRAKEFLAADDRAQLMVRAFEERILLPQGPNEGLYAAFVGVEDSIQAALKTMGRTIDTLSQIDPRALSRRLSGLSEAELHELEQAAHGVAPEVSAVEGGVSTDTVWTRHRQLINKLGADSMAHAVQISIERGVIDVKDKSSGIELTPVLQETLTAIANGAEPEAIATEAGRTRTTIHGRMTRIREELSALTTPHAVLRAYEEGILPA